MVRKLHRPSPAMMVAVLALFVALTGSGTAATLIATHRDAGSTRATYRVAMTKALHGTQALPQARAAIQRVLAHAAKATPGPRGPRGFRGPRGRTGPQGPRGPAGPAGPTGIATITAVDGPTVAQCASGGGACQVAQSDAVCPAGLRVVGGGFASATIDNITLFAASTSSTTYSVVAENLYTAGNSIKAQALCAGP